MKTQEGNKLIAEFMGGIYHSKLFHIGENQIWLPRHNMCEQSRLKYDSSWDWLMPVVEKIEKIVLNNGDCFQISIGKHKISIIRKDKLANPYLKEEIYIPVNGAKIEATWIAVVQFIEWYNNQK